MSAALLLLAVASTIYLPNGQPMQIQSDNARQDLNTGKSTWNGHVILKEGKYTLFADELSLELNDTQQPCYVNAKGAPVTAIGPLNFQPASASGETILYDCTDDVAKAVGDAKIRTSKANLTSHKIIYSFMTRHLKAEGTTERRTHMQLQKKGI